MEKRERIKEEGREGENCKDSEKGGGGCKGGELGCTQVRSGSLSAALCRAGRVLLISADQNQRTHSQLDCIPVSFPGTDSAGRYFKYKYDGQLGMSLFTSCCHRLLPSNSI